jgi:DNA polymerase III delta subunit
MPECETLALYANGEHITVAHLEQVLTLNSRMFPLMDAWLQGRVTPTFLQDIRALFTHTHPLQFLTALSTRLNYHYRIKRGLALGQTLEEIARQEGKKTYPVQKDSQLLRGVSPQQLARKRLALQYCDLAIKTGSKPAQDAVELLFLQV